MIGLYAQNIQTQKELCQLLQPFGIEPYVSGRTYHAVLWLSKQKAPKGLPILKLTDMSLPCNLAEWRTFIQRHTIEPITYENSFFHFDGAHRLITNLETKQKISLTEKENALLTFLVKAPRHQTSRELLLAHVWQYSPTAETHTLESHLYALKQKLDPYADKLLQIQKDFLKLI